MSMKHPFPVLVCNGLDWTSGDWTEKRTLDQSQDTWLWLSPGFTMTLDKPLPPALPLFEHEWSWARGSFGQI